MLWADTTQKTNLKTSIPQKTIATITDDDNIISGSMSVKEDDSQRLPQVWMYYDLKIYTESKQSNYEKWYVAVDTDAESSDKFNETRVREISSRWLDDTNTGLVVQVAGRMLNVYNETPRILKFKVDSKDSDTKTGDTISVSNRLLQAGDGSNESLIGLVIESREIELGGLIEHQVQEFFLIGRYGKIAADSMGDYTAESDANKLAYAFICYDTGVFLDSEIAYQIL